MSDLGPVAWPPAPIRTERLVLREAEARDRPAFVELLASPEVHTYLGGPRPREALERELPPVPGRWPGGFVVDLGGAMIGQIATQTANAGSMRLAAKLGFTELERFHAWDAEQWLGQLRYRQGSM